MSLLNPPFWWKWPSLPTEILSGACCFVLGAGVAAAWSAAFGLSHPFLVVTVQVATFMAFFYELALDRNGFEWRDVLQRCAGIGLAVLVVLQLF
jgi:hypothetical protein